VNIDGWQPELPYPRQAVRQRIARSAANCRAAGKSRLSGTNTARQRIRGRKRKL